VVTGQNGCLGARAGAAVFIFQRPLLAPLLALAAVAMIVVLDSVVDLSALF